MQIVDTHVHLHFPDFDADRDQVMERAKQSGVGLFINIGTDLPSSQKTLQLAESREDIFGAAGIHPHDAKDASSEAFEGIEKLLTHPKMVAIGEVGLDFFRDHSPQDVQKEVLLQFFELHKKIKKPLILHCRDAYTDLIEMIQNELKPPVAGIIHCFSSESGIMSKLLDLGFLISFAGPLTYKKNDALRKACQMCPTDRIVFETDAPFLPPQSKRGKRNETSFLIETLTTAAEVKGCSIEMLAEASTENAKRVFGL